jgi:membrane fusion protein, multidrug efflux system
MAAWWYQSKPSSASASGAATTALASGPGTSGPAAGGQAAGAPQTAAGVPGAAASAPRPPAVEAAKVEIMKLTDDTQAVGSLRSRQGVVVRPEVSGRITQLNFKDGDRVRKGQLLVQLDDQLQLAQVQQSQAELSIARANHQRNQELVAQNFISKRSVDESAANLEVAQARLALSKATAARLKVMAPFDGTVGIRTANVGDYLKDGADVVNIEDIDAVFVDFRLPERFQNKVKKGQTAGVSLDALPGSKFVAFVQAVDPLIDTNGRSVGVRACIDNRQLRLRPGMFARVTAVFGERDQAKVVPEEAIVPQGQRVVVYKVVDGKNKDEKIAQRVEVKLGIRRPGRVEILEGIDEGDMIVTAGQQRLQRDGMVVRVIDTARPGGREGGAPGSPGGGPGGASGADGGAGAAARPSSAPGMAPGAASGPASGSTSAPSSGAAPSAGSGVVAMAPATGSGARGAGGPGQGGKPGGPGGKPMAGPNPCFASASDMPSPGRTPGGRPTGADAGAGAGRPAIAPPVAQP